MLQQLVITTHDKTSLRPLLESAIENQKKTLKAGLARTQARLTEFEQRYGMTSASLTPPASARDRRDVRLHRLAHGVRHAGAAQQKYATLQEAHFVD